VNIAFPGQPAENEVTMSASHIQGKLRLKDHQDVPDWALFWPKNPPLTDPFLAELVASTPVQRLRRIGFLGAIDYLLHSNGAQAHRRRHNRFDHSVNVALLALRYATRKRLPEKQRRVLTAAALLHDIGHGPLSHTLEPAFRTLFGIDHHQAGRAIVGGTSPLGDPISKVLLKYKIDLNEILALIDGTHSGEHAFLFHSPMNLDTIEAIARCCSFSNGPVPVSPTQFVDAIADRSSFPVDMGDRFWSIKDNIYKTLILSTSGLIADTLAQQYMLSRATQFTVDNFYLDDSQLRRRHAALFAIFTYMRSRSSRQEHDPIHSLNYDVEIEAASRKFSINAIAKVYSPDDLQARYQQTKTKRSVSLKSILNIGIP
jgi:hypothetical protein